MSISDNNMTIKEAELYNGKNEKNVKVRLKSHICMNH